MYKILLVYVLRIGISTLELTYMYLDKYIGIYSSTFSKTNYIYKKVTKLNDMCAKNTRTKYKFNKSKDK